MHALVPGLPSGSQPLLEIAPRVVGILCFDGVAALDFVGPLEALKAARSFDKYHRAHSCYAVRLVGLEKERFVSESGLAFKAHATLAGLNRLDTLIIPGGNWDRLPETRDSIARWLSKNHLCARRIAAVSCGIYPLAQSGLLAGAEVATHWRYAQDVARRFPRLHVNYNASFVKYERYHTCGAGKAGLEMVLGLIEDDHGALVAKEVAREFVLRVRPSGAKETISYPAPAEGEASERLADLPAYILAHLDDNLSVEVLAQRSSLCPRHFSRLFKRVFETTPADFVERLRLAEARQRLLIPHATVKKVADSVGFKSADSFRRAFERHLGITPSAFRLRFQPGTEKKLRVSVVRHPRSRGVHSHTRAA